MADGWTIITQTQWSQMQSQFVMYQYAAVLTIFVILGIVLLFKDAWPFIWARFVTHEVIVGILDPVTRKITPNKDFKKVKGMFYYKGLPLPFVKVYPGNFMFTGLPFDILMVELHVITNPMYQKACNDLKKMGYKDIDAVERALVFSQMQPEDHRVADIMLRENYATYGEAKKAINPGNISVESPFIKQFFDSIPMSDLVDYGTKIPGDNIFNEVDDIYEARKPSMQIKRDVMKMVPLCLLIFGITAAAVVLYMVFLKPA
jgi:hypothetical protein